MLCTIAFNISNTIRYRSWLTEVNLFSDECTIMLIYRKWRLCCWILETTLPRLVRDAACSEPWSRSLPAFSCRRSRHRVEAGTSRNRRVAPSKPNSSTLSAHSFTFSRVGNAAFSAVHHCLWCSKFRKLGIETHTRTNEANERFIEKEK